MADVGTGSPASSDGTLVSPASGQADRGLRSGALKAGDVVILALASSGPTQSIAVSLAALLAAVAYASFLPLLICSIPMLGIAIGYQRLNAWQPSAGATYSWVGRALNPHAGFFSGWIMLMYYVIGTTSLTVPLGTYLLTFFSNAAASNTVDVALVGTVFDLIVLAVAALGVKLSARFQWGWAILEYGLLIGFTVAALVAIYGRHQAGAVHISRSWFTLHGAGGFSALISGIIIAIFLYSGWDTAAYVGEEAHGKKAGPAAITSVVLLFGMYSVVGQLIGGGFWSNVMIVAVLGGTLASLQAAIVSSSRIGYAMGRDRVFPAWFGRTHARHQTPWNATILFGLLNVVFLWAATLIGSIGKALADIVITLGLMAAIFYLLTSGTAVWCFRKSIAASASNFVLGGVLPGLGAAFMAFVIIYSLASGALNGIQIGFGFGFAAIGLLLSFVAKRVTGSDFYTDRSARSGSDLTASGGSAAVTGSAEVDR